MKADPPEAGCPRQLQKKEEPAVFAALRKAHERFTANGGTKCHCGGRVYQTPAGPRHTCTHGGAPLTRDEIRAIVASWPESSK